MSEPLPVERFDRIKDLSKIDEDFTKSYNKDSDKGCMRGCKNISFIIR